MGQSRLVAGARAGSLIALVALAAVAQPAAAGVYGPATRAPELSDPRSGARLAQGQVHNASELEARAHQSASGGRTYLVREGDYGSVDLHGVRHSRLVTFRAAPGERPQLGYTTMGDTSGVRLKGLRFTGGVDIQPGDNSRIQLVRNDIGGYAGVGVNLR